MRLDIGNNKVDSSLVDVAGTFWSGYQDQGPGHHVSAVKGIHATLVSLRRRRHVRDLNPDGLETGTRYHIPNPRIP